MIILQTSAHLFFVTLAVVHKIPTVSTSYNGRQKDRCELIWKIQESVTFIWEHILYWACLIRFLTLNVVLTTNARKKYERYFKNLCCLLDMSDKSQVSHVNRQQQ